MLKFVPFNSSVHVVKECCGGSQEIIGSLFQAYRPPWYWCPTLEREPSPDEILEIDAKLKELNDANPQASQ